jgi:hypothetical protein
VLAKIEILLYIFGFVVLTTPLVSRLACGRRGFLILSRAARLSCRIGYCSAGNDFGSGISVPS